MDSHTLMKINTLKTALLEAWEKDDSEAVLRFGQEILQLNSADHEVCYVMSEIYFNKNELTMAKLYAEKTISLKSDAIKAYYILGMIYDSDEDKNRKYEKIIECFNKIFLIGLHKLELKYQRQVCMITSFIYWRLEDIHQCRQYQKKMIAIGDKKFLREGYYSGYLFGLNHADDMTREEIFQEHVKYNDLFDDIVLYQHQYVEEKEKLRVGYISPDFRVHPVTYFSFQLLLQFDRKRFEVYCYSTAQKTDGVTEHLKGFVTEWRDVQEKSYAEIAKIIYEDNIDILVDLSGHTANAVLPVFAYKPAPLQISGIGYVNTTGLKTIDYFITDCYCDPQGLNDAYFTEKLLRLPSTHFCYTGNSEAPECAEAPVLKYGYITFGCFNKFKKVTDSIVRVWKKILDRVPGSKIIIKTLGFDNNLSMKMAKKKILCAGITEEQFEFRPYTFEYLNEYNELDIALDTYPCNGGTTTFEALYMGVPVVTLVGEQHVSRFGYSILKNLELEDGIAYSTEEYVEKAVAMAQDREQLVRLHRSLRERLLKSPLMCGRQYVHDMEHAYQQIWSGLVQKNANVAKSIRIEHKPAYNIMSNSISSHYEYEKIFSEDKVMEKKAVTAKRFQQINQLKKRLLSAWEKSEYREVIQLGRSVLRLNPQEHEVLYVLAEVHYNENKLAEARTYAERAIAVKSDYVRAYYLLGMTYFLSPNNALYYEKIVQLFTAAEHLELSLLERSCQSNLYAKLGQIYWELEDLAQCMKYHRKSYELEEDLYKKKIYYSAYLFELNHSAAISKETVYLAHKEYNTLLQGILPYSHTGIRRKEKLRIGYISPDFRMHPVTYFVMTLLLNFDKEKFEVYCYSNAVKTDTVTETLKPLVTKWRDVEDKEYQTTAKLIYEDEIDILVDLAGHTGNDNLTVLAYKPAPIQLSGIGYINTTGLSSVDYFITDAYCDPEGLNDAYFSEKLLRLPHTHFCYTHIGREYPCKEAPVKRNQYVTFGSFNKFKKVTDDMLAVWLKILNRVPNSKIVIKAQACSTLYGKSLTKDRLIRFGFKEEQFELRPLTNTYMNEYNDLDIVLDTYPCAGGTTTFESLYMGVPVVTLVGNSHVSRFGYSILKNLNFEEGLAYSEDEYVEKAVYLAENMELLAQMHATLRKRLQASSLMDGVQYTRDIEALYTKIWNEEVEMKLKKKNKYKYNSKADKTVQKNFDMDKIQALQQQAMQYKIEEKYEEALLVISEIFEMEYYNTEIMYELEEIYYLKGDLERAEKWGNKILLLDNKNAKTLVMLAKVYIRSNDIAKLLPLLNQLLEEEFAAIKDTVESLLDEIYLPDYEYEIEKKYKNLYRYIETKAFAQKEEVCDKDEIGGAYPQAESQLDLGNLRNLLKELGTEKKEKISLSDKLRDIFLFGLTEKTVETLQDESVDEVLACIQRYPESEANKVEICNALAVMFYEVASMEKVLPFLVKALELDRDNTQSLKNLSFALFHMGEKEMARQYLELIKQKDIAVVDLIAQIGE